MNKVAKNTSKINSKRNHKGQFVQGHSQWFIGMMWAASVGSLALVWLAARAVMSDFGSFRNCNGGTGILSVSSCGKQSLDLGDFIILGLFALSACLSFSLVTAAWRATRKGTVIA
jgi:hypothetical protein